MLILLDERMKKQVVEGGVSVVFGNRLDYIAGPSFRGGAGAQDTHHLVKPQTRVIEMEKTGADGQQQDEGQKKGLGSGRKDVFGCR